MNLYISDLHFGHNNVIRFDGRPYANWSEMDHAMIELWNARVCEDDHVYILGDFCFRNERPEEWYLRQLKGHKHLIEGNHDEKLLKNEIAMGYFESVDKMLNIVDEDKRVCLCHYPIADWYGGRKDGWHIHGHIHNRRDDVYEFMKAKERTLNAGCMLNNYMPASFEELVRNNQRFREG